MRIVITVITFLLLAASVTAQTMNEELDRLREHLGVPQTTQVELASQSTLPAKTPLKVYVATGLDGNVRDKFREWIEKWNNDEAKKLGALVQVSEIADADIILSRYTLEEKATTRTYSTVGSGTVYNPATNGTVTRPVTRTYSYDLVPVYLYIISRGETGLEILWRETNRTWPGDYRSGGHTLRDEFKKMMQARAKNH
jgi:hypothetical protein